ncbi:MAG: Asp-tRNA(Asn)/Glu-tRNA(Gln) amidotransferase GatCAB subunit C [Legionella sp.]|nr:MAG: Asp-tRNA(Asn)/Glu-tRNA(Gln) amidotransferase GatCAB subunit C [Legionella sp.]
MAMTAEQLAHTAKLAYLEPSDVMHHLEKCNAVLSSIEKLQSIDTSTILPLNHPTSVTQYLRNDDHIGAPDIRALAQCAPQFQDDLYIVPQVVKGQS